MTAKPSGTFRPIQKIQKILIGLLHPMYKPKQFPPKCNPFCKKKPL
uniref:Uncharacterized protein n=1 Tax=viral metagenome TaxID=1070528 RepID=A0A6C0JDM9_9ZZZZ